MFRTRTRRPRAGSRPGVNRPACSRATRTTCWQAAWPGTCRTTTRASRRCSPPPDGNQAGFNGDYSGIAINKGNEAHPIWSDTRNADPFAPANGVVHDEDVFTDSVNMPNGRGQRNDHGHVGDGH